jgi:hypothetical protein
LWPQPVVVVAASAESVDLIAVAAKEPGLLAVAAVVE